MSREMYLNNLRNENNGYNPEPLEFHKNLKIVASYGHLITIEDTSTGEMSEWAQTSCRTEAEYIERWPRRFGLVFQGHYFYQVS